MCLVFMALLAHVKCTFFQSEPSILKCWRLVKFGNLDNFHDLVSSSKMIYSGSPRFKHAGRVFLNTRKACLAIKDIQHDIVAILQ